MDWLDRKNGGSRAYKIYVKERLPVGQMGLCLKKKSGSTRQPANAWN